jgi:hypothetical protein
MKSEKRFFVSETLALKGALAPRGECTHWGEHEHFLHMYSLEERCYVTMSASKLPTVKVSTK